MRVRKDDCQSGQGSAQLEQGLEELDEKINPVSGFIEHADPEENVH
jgi:hypothetical protein